MKLTEIEKIIDRLKAPKGCDWNFFCGYRLAKIHFKEALKKKKK